MEFDKWDYYLIFISMALFFGGLLMLGYDLKPTGQIATVFVAEQNMVPQPSFNYGQCSGNPLMYCFRGTAYDPDGGDILLYTWDFGDGVTVRSTAEYMDHIYGAPGYYTVTLRALDDENTPNFYSKTIHVA